jgi:hypothetical protein
LFDINISDQKIKDQKIQEIGLIAQEKLNDQEFSTVIDIHNRVQNSGYSNYLRCRIENQTVSTFVFNIYPLDHRRLDRATELSPLNNYP